MQAALVSDLRNVVAGLAVRVPTKQLLVTSGFGFVMWALDQEIPLEDVFTDPLVVRFLDEVIPGKGAARNRAQGRLSRLAGAVAGTGLARLSEIVGASPSPAMPVSEVPTAVKDFIATFRPADLSPNRWDVVASSVREWVLAERPGHEDRARLAMRMVGLLAAWHVDRRGSLDARSVFDRANVDDFFAAARFPVRSERTYRSLVAAVARAVTGQQPTPSARSAGVVLPYETFEIERMLRSASSAPQERTRLALRSMLLVGAAVGVGGAGFAWMRPEHVTSDADGVLVRVPNADGSTNRVVPALAQWSEALAVHAEECAAAGLEFLAGGVGKRREKRPAILAAKLAELHGRFDPVRLRRYWTVEVFSGPVHLPTALAAAGWTTPESLSELLPLLRPVPQDVARSLLREPGGARQ